MTEIGTLGELLFILLQHAVIDTSFQESTYDLDVVVVLTIFGALLGRQFIYTMSESSLFPV
jgi:hypothetical protein